MDFPTYLNQAWSDHGTQPQQVADGFATGASLIQVPEQIPQLVGLITHVMGEHLGQWEAGETLLNSLKSNPSYVPGSESEKAIARSVAVLRLAAGNEEFLKTFSESDKIRIYALASAAVSGKNIQRAQDLFSKALTMAEPGLQKGDPAVRSLAITGNNLACALEDKKSRTPGETKLMISAAHAGRKYWELAGTWIEVQSAEYRLAMTYMAAADSERAFEHARNSVGIGVENSAGPIDMIYSLEALALAERSRGNFAGFQVAADKVKQHFAQLSEDDRFALAETVKKLGLAL